MYIENSPAVLAALKDNLPSWCSEEAQVVIELLRNEIIKLRRLHNLEHIYALGIEDQFDTILQLEAKLRKNTENE